MNELTRSHSAYHEYVSMEYEAILVGEIVKEIGRKLVAPSSSTLQTHTPQNVATFILKPVNTFNFTNKDYCGGFFRLIYDEK